MPLIIPGLTSKNGGNSNPTERWTNMLMGKKISDTPKSDETSFAKHELPKNTRVLGEGDMATMDFNPDRLNVHTDKDGIVKKVTHG